MKSRGWLSGQTAVRTVLATPQRRQNSMLRALTMLCLGTLMAPSRFSISTQDTPRWPSSQASPSPTGPAPTMITDGSLCIRPVARSLGPHIGLADDAAHVVVLLAKGGGEVRAAAPDRVQALRGKLLLDRVGLKRRAVPG